jgi:hypothetical protein
VVYQGIGQVSKFQLIDGLFEINTRTTVFFMHGKNGGEIYIFFINVLLLKYDGL